MDWQSEDRCKSILPKEGSIIKKKKKKGNNCQKKLFSEFWKLTKGLQQSEVYSFKINYNRDSILKSRDIT